MSCANLVSDNVGLLRAYYPTDRDDNDDSVLFQDSLTTSMTLSSISSSSLEDNIQLESKLNKDPLPKGLFSPIRQGLKNMIHRKPFAPTNAVEKTPLACRSAAYLDMSDLNGRDDSSLFELVWGQENGEDDESKNDSVIEVVNKELPQEAPQQFSPEEEEVDTQEDDDESHNESDGDEESSLSPESVFLETKREQLAAKPEMDSHVKRHTKKPTVNAAFSSVSAQVLSASSSSLSVSPSQLRKTQRVLGRIPRRRIVRSRSDLCDYRQQPETGSKRNEGPRYADRRPHSSQKRHLVNTQAQKGKSTEEILERCLRRMERRGIPSTETRTTTTAESAVANALCQLTDREQDAISRFALLYSSNSNNNSNTNALRKVRDNVYCSRKH